MDPKLVGAAEHVGDSERKNVGSGIPKKDVSKKDVSKKDVSKKDVPKEEDVIKLLLTLYAK